MGQILLAGFISLILASDINGWSVNGGDWKPKIPAERIKHIGYEYHHQTFISNCQII